jgi:urate oxidase
VQVSRHADRDDLRELTVHIKLEGDFAAAHLDGDNSKILPTDTMKNTVYALAKDHGHEQIEEFGLRLAGHFLTHNPQVSRAAVELSEHLWIRLTPHTFQRGGPERRWASVTSALETAELRAGIDGLVALKTRGSGFAGYVKDRYTTLEETSDRLLATSIQARWTYLHQDVAFGQVWRGVREVLLDTFAGHDSKSVQQTAYAMGEAALSSFEGIGEIQLVLPNQHCLLVDMKPFGISNANEIFLPIDEPHGQIEVTVTR